MVKNLPCNARDAGPGRSHMPRGNRVHVPQPRSLHFGSRLFICNFILFSKFWIIFTIIVLHSFSVSLLSSVISSSFVWFGYTYPVPFPAGYSSISSSCLYFCVRAGLSVFWNFVLSLYCGGFSLWVGFDGWLVKVSWLEKLVSVFCWVQLDFFSLECNKVSSNEL